MPIHIASMDEPTLESMRLGMILAEGLDKILKDLPNAKLTMKISDTIIGYHFNFPVAGCKTRQNKQFYAGYKPGFCLDGTRRSLKEAGQSMLPILARITLHAEAIANGTLPLSDIHAPALFRAILDHEGLTGHDFMRLIQNKTTSWNDGIANGFGRKVKRLPLRLKTAGEFKNGTIVMHGIEDQHGTNIQFIHDGTTPIYNFDGIIPEIIARPLIGEPLTRMVEAPDLEPYADCLIIKKFEYPKYGANHVQLSAIDSLSTAPLSDDDTLYKEIQAAMKTRLEEWTGETLDDPEQEKKAA